MGSRTHQNSNLQIAMRSDIENTCQYLYAPLLAAAVARSHLLDAAALLPLLDHICFLLHRLLPCSASAPSPPKPPQERSGLVCRLLFANPNVAGTSSFALSQPRHNPKPASSLAAVQEGGEKKRKERTTRPKLTPDLSCLTPAWDPSSATSPTPSNPCRAWS
ncbi:hypothetical protein BRADI_1g28196v3 [Brachypodium distachyon]|uniref:Uncharacterized protein n=1 Tax=Brachypodium distachyon TaxID=15368 RepID=A0A0Q3GZG0_BRADI|nr:hypothetical protein BRADI_1g28196v3 [Brachypodium distachyon]PNT75147.1 hypothetical protein BRADI_1g28196v3 [Brachypodium distachyon]